MPVVSTVFLARDVAGHEGDEVAHWDRCAFIRTVSFSVRYRSPQVELG